MGRKKSPFYRIVTVDSRKKRDGAYIDKVGFYNPVVDPAQVEISEEKAMYWLQQGAIPSDTVKNLLSKEGILLKHDMKKKGFSEEKIEEEMKKWELMQSEKRKRSEAKTVQKKEAKATVEPKAEPETEPETEPEQAPESEPEAAAEE